MPPEDEIIEAAQAEAYFNSAHDQTLSPPIPPRTEVPIEMDRDLDMNGHSILNSSGVIGEQGPAGPQGDPGPAGEDGADGTNGVNGRTILSGTVNPSIAVGSNGDFYINTSASTLYGPKTAGVWGSPTSLVGATGATGPQGDQGDPGPQGDQGPAGNDGADGSDGADGRTILSGAVAPTTEGEDGDFYLDTATNELYGPKAAGAWGSGVSLVGPEGPQGEQGIQGIQGTQGIQGETGATGPEGPEGPQGPEGPAGDLETIINTIYPVGGLYISTLSTNPGTLLGYGTWAAFGAGRVLVGRDSGDADFDTAEETGGAKTVTLTAAQSGLPAHGHTLTSQVLARGSSGTGSSELAVAGNRSVTAASVGNASAANAAEAHSIVQPYIVVYMWKRTA